MSKTWGKVSMDGRKSEPQLTRSTVNAIAPTNQTVTQNLDGGIFVSMRVEHLSLVRPDATAYLELTFTPSGYVGAAQIRLTMNGEKYDSGQVLRAQDDVTELGAIGSPDWRSAHMKLVLEVFAKLDADFKKEEGEENKGKRDLWGRLNGSQLDEANVSAALRHNLNLLLTNVGHGYGAK